MAKIIKFPPPQKPFAEQTVKIFVDYEPSKNCCNDDAYGELCVKCGKCGRKFTAGILQKEGAE